MEEAIEGSVPADFMFEAFFSPRLYNQNKPRYGELSYKPAEELIIADNLPLRQRQGILVTLFQPFRFPYNPWFHHVKQPGGMLHIQIERRTSSSNDNLDRPGNYKMVLAVPGGPWDDYTGQPKEGLSGSFQDIRSLSLAPLETRREVSELCWKNSVLEISMRNFHAAQHFIMHRKLELQHPNNIFINLQVGVERILQLPQTDELTSGLMEFLECLRLDIPIWSLNFWINMDIEGVKSLLQKTSQIPWVNSVRQLPVQKAVHFRISAPDDYDLTRKKICARVRNAAAHARYYP